MPGKGLGPDGNSPGTLPLHLMFALQWCEPFLPVVDHLQQYLLCVIITFLWLQSELYYKRAIEVYKQLYGPGDSATTRTMNNLVRQFKP